MDWMEEAHLSRPSAFLSSAPSSQLELGSGQFNHPYVAQELCVYERTVRQDTIGPNMLNFGLPGSSKVARSDLSNSLFALVSGSQQQSRPSYQTTCAAPHPHQFQHITGSTGAWHSNVPSTTRLSGCASLGPRSDFPQFGQCRETTTTHYMQLMALRDGWESTKSPNLEIFRETLSQVALENSSNANQQALFSQLLTEFLNKKQWSQNMQGVQAIPPLKRSVQLSGTAVSSNMQSSGASSSRLRVYCTSYTGLPLNGELLLTDSGRLDVICSCHFYRMSVAKFSLHAGNFSSNPGDTVHIDNGETLVQWRKALFWQYQVKVPADDAGWEWNDNNESEFEQAKYKAGPSQNFLKESEASDRSSFIVNWNRYTQICDNLCDGENPSTSQSLQSLPIYGLPSSQHVPILLQNPRESCSRPYGRLSKGDARTIFQDARPLHDLHENAPELQETASASSFRNRAGFGPVSEYFDFINHAGHSYTSTLEQQTAAREKDAQKRYSLNKWQFGREHIQQEKEILSTIELKLGQPSQQAQPVGTSFISPVGSHVPIVFIDRYKSSLHEKACQQVVDPRMQQDMRNTGACVMSSFSSANIPSKDHQLSNTQSQGSERDNAVNSVCFDIPNAQSERTVQTSAAIVRPVKDFEARMLANMNYEPDGAHLHCMLENLECHNQMDKVHVYVQKTDRKVTLESPTFTEQIATEVFVAERRDVEAFPSSRTSADISPWMASNRFLEGGVDRARGQSMPTEGIQNDCEHHSLVSNLVSRDSSKATWLQRIPEDVANLYSADTSVNPGLSPRSVFAGESHGTLYRSCGGLKGKERLSVENECDPDLSSKERQSWHEAENKLLQFSEVTKLREQVYDEWDVQEKQQELNSSNETVTENQRSQCLDEVAGSKCLQFQNDALQSNRAIKDYLLVVDTEMCDNSASSPAEVKEDKDKREAPFDAHVNVKTREGCVTIKCNKVSLGQLSTTGTSTPRIVVKTNSSSRPSRLKAFPLEVEGNKLESGSNPSTLATSSGHLVSVGENESAHLYKFPFRRMKEQSNSLDEPCSALMQWKDSGKVAHKGADLVTTCNPDEVFPAQRPLEDDLLSDTASQRISAIEGPSNLTRRQLVSNLCSKSSENVLSEFCDGEHLDGEASQGECESKRRVMNDVVDEGSGIGKCCSSNEVEMRGVKNVGLPSKTSEYVKNELRSSKCSPTDTINYCCEAKSTRTKHIISSTEADLPLHKSDVELFKLKRKRRKTMKWKKMDDTMAAAIEVMDAEAAKPMLNACHPVPMEQESTWAGLNNRFLRKRSYISAEKGVPTKRKQPGYTANPSASFMDETKMLDNSGDVSKKVNPTSHSKLDVIIRRDPVNHVTLSTKEHGYVNSRLRHARNPRSLLASQAHSEVSVKAFGMKPGPPKVLLGSLPRETSLTTNKENFKCSGSARRQILKNPSASFGRKTLKTARMVSLSSILKLPAKVPNTLFKDGSKVCIRSKTSDEPKGLGSYESDAVLLHYKNQGTTLNNKVCSNSVHTLVLPKEARKRSLWELSSREKDCSRTTYTSSPDIPDVPRGINNASQLLAINKPTPLFNKARAADAGHSCEKKWIIPRSTRSARAHVFAKMNGWQRQSSRWADVKPLGLIGMSLDASKGSNVLSPIAAPIVQIKPASKEFIQKVDQGSSPCNTITASTPKLYKSPAVSDSTLVNSAFKNRKVALGKRIYELSLKSATKEPSKKTFEMINSKAKRQSSLGRDSDSVVVSGCAEPRDFKSHIFELDFQNNQSKRGSKRTFLEDHVDIVAGKKHWKRFKSVALQSNECCCVCGSSNSDVTNRLISCSQCSIKVHQCCYGVSKVPKAAWLCRACKANVSNIACVLCGYGGGAMTRAQKTRGVVKGLLQARQEALRDKNTKLEASEPDVYKGRETGLRTEHSKKHKFMSDKVLSDSFRGDVVFDISLPGHRTVEAFENNARFYLKGCENERTVLRWQHESCNVLDSSSNKFNPSSSGSHEDNIESNLQKLWSQNTITAALDDPTVTQWVHMVCALWMPGTRCLNLGTMGVFDVSGIASARRRPVCSICKRPGGSCIQCRFSKCSVPFHAWCAHEKGLLQTEVVDDETGHVGFYGKCMTHGGLLNMQVVPPVACASKQTVIYLEKSSCARTEGYNGRQTLQEMAARRDELAITGCTAVSQEQINAWMQINERKTSGRRFIKPPNSDIKIDHREYTRFKQEQGWRRLAVYKSGIHALGLYTAETILRGEMVVEYIGEIVGLRVADKREAYYHAGKRMQYKGACYLFRIDEESIIDATRKGGIARFVNHSCSPNCVAKVICVKNQKKVVFFAERDINAGEEITYDYQFNDEKDGDKIPCLCRSKECRKSLN